MSSDDDDLKTLLPTSPREVRGRPRQVDPDHGQSHNHNSQLPPVRIPTGIQPVPQPVSTQRGESPDWPLLSPTGQRADLPNGVTDENERFGVAL